MPASEYTFKSAPKGYAGPVRLTDAEKRLRDEAAARWHESLLRLAADHSDPEVQGNARLLLARGARLNRGGVSVAGPAL